MKDKEKQEKVFDILAKMEFFQGQRAGRELWNDKPKEVQDQDIADFVRDIKYIRSYLKDSVVLTERELLDNCELQYDAGYKKALADLEKDSVVLSKEEYELYDVVKKGYPNDMTCLAEKFTQIDHKARKETAKKILKHLLNFIENETFHVGYELDKVDREINKLATQFGVEIKD